jgi:hypothetical protein
LLGGGTLNFRKRVEVDTGRGLGFNLRVRLSTFQFIKTLKKGATGTRNSGKTSSVRDATNEDNLSGIAASRFLGSNVDLNITANSRDAIKVEVITKTSKLK